MRHVAYGAAKHHLRVERVADNVTVLRADDEVVLAHARTRNRGARVCKDGRGLPSVEAPRVQVASHAAREEQAAVGGEQGAAQQKTHTRKESCNVLMRAPAEETYSSNYSEFQVYASAISFKTSTVLLQALVEH